MSFLEVNIGSGADLETLKNAITNEMTSKCKVDRCKCLFDASLSKAEEKKKRNDCNKRVSSLCSMFVGISIIIGEFESNKHKNPKVSKDPKVFFKRAKDYVDRYKSIFAPSPPAVVSPPSPPAVVSSSPVPTSAYIPVYFEVNTPPPVNALPDVYFPVHVKHGFFTPLVYLPYLYNPVLIPVYTPPPPISYVYFPVYV